MFASKRPSRWPLSTLILSALLFLSVGVPNFASAAALPAELESTLFRAFLQSEGFGDSFTYHVLGRATYPSEESAERVLRVLRRVDNPALIEDITTRVRNVISHEGEILETLERSRENRPFSSDYERTRQIQSVQIGELRRTLDMAGRPDENVIAFTNGNTHAHSGGLNRLRDQFLMNAKDNAALSQIIELGEARNALFNATPEQYADRLVEAMEAHNRAVEILEEAVNLGGISEARSHDLHALYREIATADVTAWPSETVRVSVRRNHEQIFRTYRARRNQLDSINTLLLSQR